MALAAVLGNVVAVSTLVLGHGSVKLGVFAVQPRLAQHMRLTRSMTVVADSRPGFKGTLEFMTTVAHGLAFLEFLVALHTVSPIRSPGNLTAVRAEVAFETSGDIFLVFPVNVMTFYTGCRSLRHYLTAVKGFCIYELWVGPGLGMNLIILRRIGILFRAGQRKEYKHQQADVCR